jgi:TPR repeat protein
VNYLLKCLVVLATLIWIAVGAVAGPYEDGVAAAKRGEHAIALRIFRSLAEKGDAKGQNGLGKLYHDGMGVPQSYVEALNWYRKSAEQGYASAQNNLGLMYANGQGVTQDHAEAVK